MGIILGCGTYSFLARPPACFRMWSQTMLRGVSMGSTMLMQALNVALDITARIGHAVEECLLRPLAAVLGRLHPAILYCDWLIW